MNKARRTRGKDGRFLTGNPGGPGRPRRQPEPRYRDLVVETISAEMFRALCQSTYALAMAGDVAAREWIGRHLLAASPLLRSTLTGPQFSEAHTQLPPPSAFRVIRDSVKKRQRKSDL